MKKRGKSKLLAILGISVILLLITSVLITAMNNSDIEQAIQEKSNKEIPGNVEGYVEQFVKKQGIGAEEINKITQVNFEDLPKEVNIENVNNANPANITEKIQINKSEPKEENTSIESEPIEDEQIDESKSDENEIFESNLSENSNTETSSVTEGAISQVLSSISNFFLGFFKSYGNERI